MRITYRVVEYYVAAGVDVKQLDLFGVGVDDVVSAAYLVHRVQRDHTSVRVDEELVALCVDDEVLVPGSETQRVAVYVSSVNVGYLQRCGGGDDGGGQYVGRSHVRHHALNTTEEINPTQPP